MVALHQINAYEEDDSLVVDMCCYDNAETIGEYFFEKLLDKTYTPTAGAEPRRLVIPLNPDSGVLDDEFAEKFDNGRSVLCKWRVLAPVRGNY